MKLKQTITNLVSSHPDYFDDNIKLEEVYDYLLMRLDWIKPHLEDLEDDSIETLCVIEYLLKTIQSIEEKKCAECSKLFLDIGTYCSHDCFKKSLPF